MLTVYKWRCKTCEMKCWQGVKLFSIFSVQLHSYSQKAIAAILCTIKMLNYILIKNVTCDFPQVRITRLIYMHKKTNYLCLRKYIFLKHFYRYYMLKLQYIIAINLYLLSIQLNIRLSYEFIFTCVHISHKIINDISTKKILL